MLDERLQTVPGCDWATVTGDGVDLPVTWSRGRPERDSAPVRLEFQLRQAQLFGFNVR
jgi:hypothetical protein